MKFLPFMFVALFAGGFSAAAQQKTTDKAIIKTPGVQCEECKNRIERSMFKQYGIISAVVNVKNKTTTVAWVTDRTDIEQIKTMIANAGFDADDVTADEDAYKKLPSTCKKPTEIKKP